MSSLNDKNNPYFFYFLKYFLNVCDELAVKFMVMYINRPDFETTLGLYFVRRVEKDVQWKLLNSAPLIRKIG